MRCFSILKTATSSHCGHLHASQKYLSVPSKQSTKRKCTVDEIMEILTDENIAWWEKGAPEWARISEIERIFRLHGKKDGFEKALKLLKGSTREKQLKDFNDALKIKHDFDIKVFKGGMDEKTKIQWMKEILLKSDPKNYEDIQDDDVSNLYSAYLESAGGCAKGPMAPEASVEWMKEILIKKDAEKYKDIQDEDVANLYSAYLVSVGGCAKGPMAPEAAKEWLKKTNAGGGSKKGPMTPEDAVEWRKKSVAGGGSKKGKMKEGKKKTDHANLSVAGGGLPLNPTEVQKMKVSLKRGNAMIVQGHLELLVGTDTLYVKREAVEQSNYSHAEFQFNVSVGHDEQVDAWVMIADNKQFISVKGIVSHLSDLKGRSKNLKDAWRYLYITSSNELFMKGSNKDGWTFGKKQ